MAGRHLKDLIAAYGEQDDLKFRRAAQAIIQEEESKRHTVLAKDLKKLLSGSTATLVTERSSLPEPPVDRESSLPLARISEGLGYLSDLVLAPRVAAQLESVVHEVQHWPELDAAGVRRRNRVLLYGPPGCGKTTAVKALASELNRPLVTARVEGLMSSYLGESAANITNLFEFANAGHYVLFLDEFDSIGKSREDSTDHGELRRVVNSVLQLVDAYAGPSLIVAATNHPHVLDAAMWRRFNSVIELPLPTPDEARTLLERDLPPGSKEILDPAVQALSGLPHAAIEFFIDAIRRHEILSRDRQSTKDYSAQALEETVSRPWV